MYVVANNLYGWAMSEPQHYGKIEMWHGHPDLHMKKIEEILNTSDDSYIVYFVEVDLRYPDNIKEKTKNFPFCPENKVFPKDKSIDYMKKMKPKNYTKSKRYYVTALIKRSIWTNKGFWNFMLDMGWQWMKFMK